MTESSSLRDRVATVIDLHMEREHGTGSTATADVIGLVEQDTAERIAAWLDMKRTEIPRDHSEGVAARVELAGIVVEIRSGAWRRS